MSKAIDGKANQILRIIDAENNFVYDVTVTAEEYERAQTDMEFATQLMYDSRKPTPEENDQENIAETENTENQNQQINSQYMWSETATKFLTTLYKDLCKEDNVSQKVLFEKIASQLKTHGYMATAKQCQTKMDALKRQYKLIKDHNNKSGNSRKDWPYLEIMDEIFGSRAWASPLSTMSSTSRSEDEFANKALDTPKRKDIISRKRVGSRQEDLLDDFLKQKKEEREERQRRHEEKMQRIDKMNYLLEQFISKNLAIYRNPHPKS